MRWTAVANPTAGRGRTRALLPKLRRAFEERDVALHVSLDADDGRRIAEEACARGEGVVACGGDGTVAGIAAVAADAGAPLAVIPTGAGNDFARELGLSHRHVFEAVSLLDAGELITVDLGRACTDDGTAYVFTTVANTGFDAEANRWANDVTWLAGTPLYVLAMLRTLAAHRPTPTHLRVDDDEWSGNAWLVAIGNTRWYASGMMITPDARIDDGQLDVCVVGECSVGRLVTRFPRVFRGTHTSLAQVTTLRGTHIEVAASAPDTTTRPELWASGERVGPLPARVEVMPHALQVLARPGRVAVS